MDLTRCRLPGFSLGRRSSVTPANQALPQTEDPSIAEAKKREAKKANRRKALLTAEAGGSGLGGDIGLGTPGGGFGGDVVSI